MELVGFVPAAGVIFDVVETEEEVRTVPEAEEDEVTVVTFFATEVTLAVDGLVGAAEGGTSFFGMGRAEEEEVELLLDADEADGVSSSAFRLHQRH